LGARSAGLDNGAHPGGSVDCPAMAVAALSEHVPVREVARRTGLLDALPDGHLFAAIPEALELQEREPNRRRPAEETSRP
jgi:hypothetical protein